MGLTYTKLKSHIAGFKYEINFDRPIPYQLINWIQEDRNNRDYQVYRDAELSIKQSVLLKKYKDVVIVLLRWS